MHVNDLFIKKRVSFVGKYVLPTMEMGKYLLPIKLAIWRLWVNATYPNLPSGIVGITGLPTHQKWTVL